MPVFHVRDTTADDSDKTILTVPAGYVAQVHYLQVSLATNATAGNRRLRVLVTDSGDTEVVRIDCGDVQAASLTHVYQMFPGGARETAETTTVLSINLSCPRHLVLLPGWKLRVYDSTAVAAAADDMTTNLVYSLVDQDDADKLL